MLKLPGVLKFEEYCLLESDVSEERAAFITGIGKSENTYQSTGCHNPYDGIHNHGRENLGSRTPVPAWLPPSLFSFPAYSSCFLMFSVQVKLKLLKHYAMKAYGGVDI
jgi:hypothetical protein